MKSMSSIIFYVTILIFLHVSLSTCEVFLTDHNANDDDQSPNITSITIDLIHRDSPRSPFYDPSLTPTQRLVNLFRRSLNNLNRSKSAQAPEIDIIRNDGDYLMYYKIGTPPILTLGVVDTGSDLTWTQCSPCINCFEQNLTVFNRELSLTYEKITCRNPICKKMPGTFCSPRINACSYSVKYVDQSSSEGQLSIETLGLSSAGSVSAKITNFLFGCGDRNSGNFRGGESGVVGLGGGPYSLINQLGPWARGRFSYCLMLFLDDDDGKTPSKLMFGDSGVVSGEGVVSTPMVSKDPSTFYHVTLLGISVGDQRLDFGNSSGGGEGNFVVDSGTTLVLLPQGMYDRVKSAVTSQVEMKVTDDPKSIFDLCFHVEKTNFGQPKITFHFQGGDLGLDFFNMFSRTTDDNLCLAASPVSEGEPAIFGYLAQANFLVGYDLEKKLVSFKPADCAHLHK